METFDRIWRCIIEICVFTQIMSCCFRTRDVFTVELALKPTEMSLESCLPSEEVLRISLGGLWLL